MGFLTFFPASSDTQSHQNPMPTVVVPPSSASSSSSRSQRRPSTRSSKQRKIQTPAKPPSSWDQFKSLLSCKQVDLPPPMLHDPSKKPAGPTARASACRSIRDVVHANARVVHRADHSPESSSLGLARRPAHASSTRSFASSTTTGTGSGSFSAGASSTASSSSRSRQQLRKLSGCYECHMIVDPCRYPITPRSVCACPQCGDIFPKVESLEHHQAIRHAVSDLGPEDSGRNIVEIIFKSSWMKKENPMCKIERILKVHNTARTIQRFEECRDAVKARANAKRSVRCAADGNELLRFQCTPLACALGSRGSSSLCADFPACGVCTVIRHGFQGSKGVRTTASSGRAHDLLDCPDGRRAMLVCRVIAGRVRWTPPGDSGVAEEAAAAAAAATSYDSVAAASSGVYSNLEDLVVFNPKAILPCFVVIYKTHNVS